LALFISLDLVFIDFSETIKINNECVENNNKSSIIKIKEERWISCN